MATTVGAAILSDEMVVAQSDKIVGGTDVETLVIEFDQSKYEDFLSLGKSSPTKARKYRRVSYETTTQVASDDSTWVNLEEKFMPLKEEAPITSRQAKK